MVEDPIPVTVLSGALGAGKTTLLNHLLENADRRLAVLVNDLGALNVDASLVAEGATLGGEGGGVAQLENGCICCERRDDLETEVVRLARSREFDHLVVESSGISEPAPVARTFVSGPAAAAYDLDTLVTVLDGESFLSLLDGDALERVETDDGPRPLSDLVVEGIECCDVLLVNKCDLLDEGDRRRVVETVRELQPRARLLETEFSRVEPGEVLETGRFDPEAMAGMTAWRRVHDGEQDHDDDHGHTHPEERYGVTSFVYRSREPFDPGRFAAFLGDLPRTVIRTKGTCWVAGRDGVALLVSGVGPRTRVEATEEWIAARHEVERELYRENHPEIPWDEEVGDRRTELVVIGREMDEERVREALDACLTDGGAEQGTDEFPSELGDVVEFTSGAAGGRGRPR